VSCRNELERESMVLIDTSLVLPDSHTRRETLDWLRVDLERLKTEADLVSSSDTMSETTARD
jgi:hypothetical protein